MILDGRMERLENFVYEHTGWWQIVIPLSVFAIGGVLTAVTDNWKYAFVGICAIGFMTIWSEIGFFAAIERGKTKDVRKKIKEKIVWEKAYNKAEICALKSQAAKIKAEKKVIR